MLTLALDASTYTGDVALMEDGQVLAESSVAMKDPSHERLMPAVAQVLTDGRKSVAELDRIVCGAGPGSFTSLRIAGGIAKGLAAGAKKPLYVVSSLALIVGGAPVGVGRYLAALDALRGEFYVGLFHRSATGDVLELEAARLVAAGEVPAVAAEYAARILSPSPIGGDGILAFPRAHAVVGLEQALVARGPVDLGAWEPSYGRLAEAQVKWESAHGRPLPV